MANKLVQKNVKDMDINEMVLLVLVELRALNKKLNVLIPKEPSSVTISLSAESMTDSVTCSPLLKFEGGVKN